MIPGHAAGTRARTPRVSVCIPSFNYARFLPRAIESVLDQSFADIELLVVDDCSRDGTKEIVAGYASRDGRIVFRENPVNLGMVPNWNLCLGESRGEYVKFLFADDFLASRDALRRMADILDADASVSLVASARRLVDRDDGDLGMVSHFEDGTATDGREVVRRCLVDSPRNLIGEPSAVMFRKRQAARGFNAKYRHLVDLEMWFHLLEQGRFAFIGEPLAAFRVHPAQQTHVNVRNLAHVDDMIHLLSDYVLNGGRHMDSAPFEKHYLMYNVRYLIWKDYRKALSSDRGAIARISEDFSAFLFFLVYPCYKIYKPFRKLRAFLARRFSRDGRGRRCADDGGAAPAGGRREP